MHRPMLIAGALLIACSGREKSEEVPAPPTPPPVAAKVDAAPVASVADAAQPARPPLAPAQKLACTEPMSRKAICKCLIGEDDDWDWTCTVREAEHGFCIADTVGRDGSGHAYGFYLLLAGEPDRLRVVSRLGEEIFGRRYVVEYQRKPIVPLTVHGDRTVMLVEEAMARTPGESLAEVVHTSRYHTYCVVRGQEVTCPLRLRHYYRYDVTPSEDASDEDRQEYEKKYGQPLPLTRGFQLDVRVDADGIATVTLADGTMEKTDEDGDPLVQPGRYSLW